MTVSNGKPALIEVYPYRDERGVVLYEVLRYSPKDFRVRRPDGKGGYVWKLDGVERVPYRLPQLLAAMEDGDDIFVRKGEKDADAVAEPVSAQRPLRAARGWTWTAAFVEHFRSAKSNRVIFVPDCDEGKRKRERKGREAARDYATPMRRLVDDVRSIELAADNDDGYDVSDWIAGGHAADEPLALAEIARIVDRAATHDNGNSANGKSETNGAG